MKAVHGDATHLVPKMCFKKKVLNHGFIWWLLGANLIKQRYFIQIRYTLWQIKGINAKSLNFKPL
jgi:hypothetical protein